MTEDDKERIVRALEKQALGLELDAQDRWCLKVHEKHECESKTVRAQPLDTVFVDDASGFGEDQQYPQHFIDDIGFVIHILRQEFHAEDEKLAKNLTELLNKCTQQQEAAENVRVRELEREVAELRGELRATRSMIDDARSNNIIDVPRSA
jgi:hypothetical protein